MLTAALIIGAGTGLVVLHATSTPDRTSTFGLTLGSAPAPRSSATPQMINGPTGPVAVDAAGAIDPRLNTTGTSTAGLRAYEDENGRFTVWDTAGPVPVGVLDDVSKRVSAATRGQDAASSLSDEPSMPGSTAPPIAGGGAQLPTDLTSVVEAVRAGTGKHLVAIIPPVSSSQPWAVIVDAGDYTMNASRPDQAAARAYADAFVAGQADPSGFILIDPSAH